LFRWTGWSLCAPRPGLSLKSETAADSQVQAEVPSRPEEVAERGNGVRATFKAQKGTLPRLRFGQLYRFRARIADLAGNSLTVDDATLGPLEQASEAVGYWRFEPVDPPVLVHRARVSEGESLERMVIRSNHDCGTADYAATEPFATAITAPASHDFEYPAENERHVVPPKSSQQQCETHGLFDGYFGDWEKIKEGYAIAAREAGTLYESPDAAAQIELVTPTSAPAGGYHRQPAACPAGRSQPGGRPAGRRSICDPSRGAPGHPLAAGRRIRRRRDPHRAGPCPAGRGRREEAGRLLRHPVHAEPAAGDPRPPWRGLAGQRRLPPDPGGTVADGDRAAL
jgi:hypothetical protein